MSSGVAEQTNKVMISDAGPSRKKISIEIPAEVVTDRIKQAMSMAAASAELPGFRRGRVPQQLIEKKFGAGIRQDAKQQLVSEAYGQAVEAHKLQVIGDPTSQTLGKLELVSGQSFAFEIEVEILPEFDLPSLDGISVKKPVVNVTDEIIEKQLETYRINEGTLESREVPEAGDYVTGHAIMKSEADGTTFYDLNGAVVQIPADDKNGRGMILGVMVEDFGKQFGLPKAGETATIRVVGPENHEVEALRGLNVVITFTVSRVDRIVPATTDYLVQMYGLESEQQLREQTRLSAEGQLRVRQQSVLRAQISKYLDENTKIDLPERLTAQQAARTLERRRMELMYRGVSPQDIEMHMAELREDANKAARRELRLAFILNKAAEHLKVGVNEGEVNSYIVQMAQSQGARPDQLRQQLIQNNQIGGIVQTVREHKTLDAILAKASVTEMDSEEYNALARSGQI
ncbi:MAG: trigger factor [Phycisphaeraceae bacterium]|nr:trigger factor [Phycisphaeraceae bacterium]